MSKICISNLIQPEWKGQSGEVQVGSHHFTGSASEGCPNFGIFLDETWREWTLDLFARVWYIV